RPSGWTRRTSRALMRSLIRSSLSTGVAMRHHSKRETGGRWKATSAPCTLQLLCSLQLLWRSFDPDALRKNIVAGWEPEAPLSSLLFAPRVAVRGNDLDPFGRAAGRRRGRRRRGRGAAARWSAGDGGARGR